MASKVQDAAFLLGAVIAMIAFGLLIVLTRPAGPVNTEASPSASAIASLSPIPSIVITTQAPATSAPGRTSAVPTSAAPAPATAAPTASIAPRTPTPVPLPSASR